MTSELRLHIDRRISFADGTAFGETGPYERLVGRIDCAIDPGDAMYADVVDLHLAPRNAAGKVEYSVDLDIIKPVDMTKGNRRLLYEVSNRGNRSLLRSFNDAPASADPTTIEHAGNGFLMRRGYTLVWSGWQGDLVPGNGMITASFPEAKQDGQRLQGTVRQEFIADKEGVLSMPLSGAENIEVYPVTRPETATLTAREHERDERVPVGEEQWSFAKAKRNGGGTVETEPSTTDLYLHEGFRPGSIYELIYETEGSRVLGLGLPAIAEAVSFLRFEDADAADTPNPLAGAIDKAYGFGASLSARVVREFVYRGFNEAGERQVFEAVYPHVSGGGRTFFNQRFGQVGRFPRQHEEHQWPSERYPFAYAQAPDLFSEKLDSVLKRPESDPLVVHTHTSTEYWQRHASVGQMDLRSGEDLEMPSTVRAYHLASFPHAAALPGVVQLGQQAMNPLASAPFMRACLELMDAWATTGTAPPPSVLPRRDTGTLLEPEEVLSKYPKVPGVVYPHSPGHLPLYDYGPDFEQGQVTKHPPEPVGDNEYPVYVPAIDADGNDLGGLRSPDIEVPVGTFTGWSVRKAGFGEGDLFSLSGSFIPFARTKAERLAAGDPRLSIEERYASHEDYVRLVSDAAARLVQQRLLLPEDGERYVAGARAKNPLDPATRLGPLLGD